MLKQTELNEKMDVVWRKIRVFFAINTAQYEDKAVEGITYTNVGAGTIVPAGNAKQFVEEFNQACDEHAKETLAKHGKEKIIMYELQNHEFQFSQDVDDTLRALTQYGITAEDVKEVVPAYMRKCMANDWF